MNRSRSCCAMLLTLSICFTATDVFKPTVALAGIVPDGSRVFMTVSGQSNVCPGGTCAITAGPTVPLVFPLTTFTDPRGSNFGYITASEDVMTGKTMQETLNSNTSDFNYMAINDTYTVHGTANGSFPITATFHITGTYGSLPNSTFGNLMGTVATQLEIGTFHPEATLTQFVIDPFPADAQNPMAAQVSEVHSAMASPTPLVFPWDVQVSYTKMVSVNDVFDFAYGLDMNISSSAQMNVNPDGLDVVSFALPEGVYLTSALGATFGTPPNLVGDYNADNAVDAADYTVWRDNLDSTVTLPNDPSPGMVTQDDYDTWQTHFGETAGSGSGARADTSVPEPATLELLMLAAASGVSSDARPHRRSKNSIGA